MRGALLCLASALGLACASGFTRDAGVDERDGSGGPPDSPPLYMDDPPDAPPVDAAPCTGGDAQIVGPDHRCYLLFTNAATWQGARAACQALSPSADLATPTTAEEDGLLRTLAGDRTIWFGLSDGSTEGAWTWVSGEAFAYSHWAAGEPNGGVGGVQDEDCVELRGALGGVWDDDPCSVAQPYFCER